MKTHLGRLLHRSGTLALVLGSGLVIMGLSQCRMMNDPVTGVDVRNNGVYGDDKDDDDDRDEKGRGVSACEHQCQREYRQCRRAENRRHEEAKDACRKIKDTSERRMCRKAEERLHRAEVRECRAERRQCKRECRYREGSGKGGR